jgi:NTP pyrophosphatase (non-canonical NTP hydrolase)
MTDLQYTLPFEEFERDMKRLSQTPLDMTREFAIAMKQGINHGHNPDNLTSQSDMRINLLVEEMEEVLNAYRYENKEALLKELADLVYVTYGFAAHVGWDLDEGVRRVHESNMSKLDENGQPIYREDGKVLKGPNYLPPNLKDLV